MVTRKNQIRLNELIQDLKDKNFKYEAKSEKEINGLFLSLAAVSLELRSKIPQTWSLRFSAENLAKERNTVRCRRRCPVAVATWNPREFRWPSGQGTP